VRHVGIVQYRFYNIKQKINVGSNFRTLVICLEGDFLGSTGRAGLTSYNYTFFLVVNGLSPKVMSERRKKRDKIFPTAENTADTAFPLFTKVKTMMV